MRIYGPIHEGFVRYCQVRAYGKWEAEDLVQESILAAFEKFELVQDHKAMLGYLMKIASNKLADAHRKKSPDKESAEEYLGKFIDPEVAADLVLMFDKINDMPEHMREALLLFELQGYSMKEIAEMMDKSEGAVKVLVHRSREHLKHELREVKVRSEMSLMFSMLF